MIEIASFNCNSVRKNIDAVNSLLKTNDIVALQELMLCESDVDFLSTIDGDFYYHAFLKDKNLNSIATGRPTKGVAIFWKKSFSSVNSISVNEWLNGIIFDTNIGKILLINVYLPCDTGNNDSLHEFRDSLATLSCVVDEYNVNNVLIVGDYNADPFKGRMWRELNIFINNYSLRSEVDLLGPDCFTYLSPAHDTTSYIDHLLCNNNLYAKLQKVSVNYSLALYDHFPLEILLDVNVIDRICPDVIDVKKFINWNNLAVNDLSDYRDNIDQLLMDWHNHPMFSCRGCDSTIHREAIESFYDFLTESLVYASNHMINTKKKFPKCVPGWNDFVKTKYKIASCCFLKWKDSGKPLYGPLSDSMKESRAIFKKVFYDCKRDREAIIQEKIAVDS